MGSTTNDGKKPWVFADMGTVFYVSATLMVTEEQICFVMLATVVYFMHILEGHSLPQDLKDGAVIRQVYITSSSYG